jgi:hypothetical protein
MDCLRLVAFPRSEHRPPPRTNNVHSRFRSGPLKHDFLFITACWPWSWCRPFRFVFGINRQRVVAVVAVARAVVNAEDRRHAGELVFVWCDARHVG